MSIRWLLKNLIIKVEFSKCTTLKFYLKQEKSWVLEGERQKKREKKRKEPVGHGLRSPWNLVRSFGGRGSKRVGWVRTLLACKECVYELRQRENLCCWTNEAPASFAKGSIKRASTYARFLLSPIYYKKNRKLVLCSWYSESWDWQGWS